MKWTKTKLGEFAPFVYGKGLPQAKRIEGAIPVYGSNGIVGTHSEALVKEPAVIIGRKGSVGEVHLSKGQSWPIDTAFYALGSENADLNFLFYLLKTLPITSNSDSAVPGLNRDFAHSLEILVPEIRGQIVIGNILANIDAKISGNENSSRTLEDIAQAIFKSWFIDFDPVKAKMVGQKPAGMDDATAGLFPDSMEESELGLIPKSWKVSNLDSLSNVRYGAPFASKFFNTTKDGIPLIRIRDLKKQSISTWSPENHAKGFLVTAGELLVGMDGEFNPTIWFGEDAHVNQRICKIEPNSFVSNFYLYFTLLPIMRRIEHGSTGSTVIHLGQTDIDAIKVIEPSQEILAAYKSMVEPMLRQIVSLNVQTRILQYKLDALLPRLISGELQIPEEMLAS
jgi:type I restriction enzyme S subunit